jgi:hypothetical protein
MTAVKYKAYDNDLMNLAQAQEDDSLGSSSIQPEREVRAEPRQVGAGSMKCRVSVFVRKLCSCTYLNSCTSATLAYASCDVAVRSLAAVKISNAVA